MSPKISGCLNMHAVILLSRSLWSRAALASASSKFSFSEIPYRGVPALPRTKILRGPCCPTSGLSRHVVQPVRSSIPSTFGASTGTYWPMISPTNRAKILGLGASGVSFAFRDCDLGISNGVSLSQNDGGLLFNAMDICNEP